ncbi:MAG: aldehyde ferredoxin oxidoreductase family protein [Chloroflexi bacterium]|nr:aldehyde ferredoxin oxidoreductase family protein [Chloroflexota bacterium]
MYSYTGRILHIDLTTKKSWVQHIHEDFLKKYVGGVGLATRLAYDNTPKGVDPLGPDNALCFACSAFGGTIVPVGTKHGVASKSPLTGFIADSLASSYFSQTMRRAGYDGIVIKGRAEKPTWIFIDDDLVEFRDAADLWGKGCFETEELIRQKIGDETVRVSSIGVAGENLIRFASIGNDRGRQAGRCGNGAVMGSKNLKAIAIRGSHPIKVADLEGLKKACLPLIKLAQGSATEKYRILGTPANVLAMNRIGVLPTRNFQQTTFEGAEKVSGEYMHEHFTEKAVACSGCAIACEQVTSVAEGPYTGARVSIDYETLYALGPNCGIDYFPAIIKLADQCDHYGMDTLSTGVTVSFAMECYQRGVLTKGDFDGLEMEFGNHEAAVALVDKIAHRDGIGDVLAEGVKRASAEIGKGSEKWAMHVKGLEMCGYDPRSLKTFAVGLAVGTRGGCHNRSLAYEADIKGEVDRFKMEKGRGKIVKEKEEYASLYDIVMLCKFLRGCFKDFHAEVSRLYTMTTGIEMTPDDLRTLGERVCNLKKAFNIREGWTKQDDWLPPRFTEEPIPDGPAKGHYVTPEELRLGIDDYYEARGWTKDGLIPKEKLIELGLEDIAEEVGV